MGRPRKAAGKTENQKKTKTIRGYIIREDKIAFDEDAVFSEEDDDFDFASKSVKKIPVNKTKVLIQTLDDNGVMASTCYVQGKFPYIGQWWHVTVEAKESYGTWYSESVPSYRLRPDLATRKTVFNPMIRSVLHSEEISKSGQTVEVKKFLSFLDQKIFPDYSELYRIAKLVELITQCAYQQHREPEQHAILALLPHLHNSKELKVINVAIDCPVLMMKLPLLLPKISHHLIEHGVTLDNTFLPKVEKMIVHKPYELAFHSVIKKKTRTSFGEVHWENFNKAGMWTGMEQPYKDAIMVYYVLKDHCMSTGDTYCSIHRLNGQTPRYKGYILTRYTDALEYMKSNGTIIEEDERVYLKRLHESELNICKIVSDMLETPEPFTFETDFECEPLKTLAGDPDQRRAAELIAKKSVVVMSGRGGCGKTEVVSRVCQVALEKIYQQKKKEHDDFVKKLIHKAMGKKPTQGTKVIDISEVTGAKGDGVDNSNETPGCHDTLDSGIDKDHHQPQINKATDLSPESHEQCNQSTSPNIDNPSPKTKILNPPDNLDTSNTQDNNNLASHTKDNVDSNHPNRSVSQEISQSGSDIDLFADDVNDDATDIDDDDDDTDFDEGFTVVKGKAVCESTQLPNPDASFYSEFDESSQSDYNPFSDEGDDPFAGEEDEGPPPPDESKKSYILLTAPTGKAAKVLGKRTGFTGFTLHQITFRYILWMRDGGPAVRPFPFKEAAILVVDECSLVAVSNLSFLLYILTEHAKLQRIIFLGDIQQLPSIEPGNFLPDVYGGLSCKGCSVSLRTNHRSEGKLIIENAIRISGRGVPLFDNKRNFTMVPLTEKEHIELDRDQAVRNLHRTEAFSTDKTSQFVAFRRIDCEAVNNVCAKMYTNQICIDPTTKRPMFHENFKICCSKNGTVPVIILHDPNNEAKEHVTTKTKSNTGGILSNDQSAEESEEERLERKRQEINDKILNYIERAKNQSINGQISEEKGAELETQIQEEEELINEEIKKTESEKKKEKAVDMRLCNGEMFWINSIFEEPPQPGKKAEERWVIESEDGMTLTAQRRALMKECRMKPSWCRTIHTYQGSEIKHLAYVVGNAGRQNWQHVYTAVTRGKSSVTIIGEDDMLRRAVGTSNQKRFCCLEEKLKERFLGVTVKKANPDKDPRVMGKPVPDPDPPYSGHPAHPAPSSRVHYVSDDELEEMIDQEMIWGDQTFSSQTQSVTTSAYPASFQSAGSMVPPKKKHKAAHNAQEMGDGFDDFDGNIRQNFYQQAITSNHPATEDLGFSTEDEDDLLLASQQADSEYPLNPHSDLTDNQGHIKVVNCRVLTNQGSGNDSIVIVPESPSPS